MTSQLRQTNQICHLLEPDFSTLDFNAHFLNKINVIIIKCRFLRVLCGTIKQIHNVCLSHASITRAIFSTAAQR